MHSQFAERQPVRAARCQDFIRKMEAQVGSLGVSELDRVIVGLYHDLTQVEVDLALLRRKPHAPAAPVYAAMRAGILERLERARARRRELARQAAAQLA